MPAHSVRAGDGLAVDQDRIVGDGVQLGLHDAGQVAEGVAAGAVDLRDAAERVGVLHLAAVGVAGEDFAAGHEAIHVHGRLDRAAVRAEGDEPLIEGAQAAAAGLERHGGDDVGQFREPRGAGGNGRGVCEHELRAVDEGQPVFGAERYRGDARLSECGIGRERLAAAANVAAADHGHDHVGEGREVAAGAEGSARRDDRQHVGVEHGKEALDHGRLDAAMAVREGLNLEEHHPADQFVGHGRSDADGVRDDEVFL
jgi:hypothetical protein